MKFGEHLVRRNLIKESVVHEGLGIQRYKKDRLGRILRDLGHIDQSILNRELKLHLKPIFHADHQNLKLSEAVLKDHQKQKWADERQVLIQTETPEKIILLSKDYRDEVVEDVEKSFRKACELLCVKEDVFDYLKEKTHPAAAQKLIVESRENDDQRVAKTEAYTSLFRDALLQAQKQSASDIHFEPTREGIDIRFRVFGDMTKPWKQLSLEHRQSFMNEVKRLSNLSIAVSGKPQDGRISFKSWNLDVRANLLPTLYGEKIVLRLLDLKREFQLSALGLEEDVLEDLKSTLHFKNGVVLISGPTGSGKTTTLYTLLSAIDRKMKNIVTLEDPVEYGLDGINQVKIDRKLSFNDALRSVLRQDPDVILVGEVRDPETADLCFKAAATGHLVLSTIHANGAAEVITRLMNLGVEPYMIESNLRYSAAQRLVKSICPKCSPSLSSAHDNDPDVMKLVATLGSPENFRTKGVGCEACREGITGRVALLEYMRKEEIKEYLSTELKTTPKLVQSLREAALRKSRAGTIDVKEVSYVA